MKMSAVSTSTLASIPEGSAKLPQKHVLFLSARWRSDQHGISAVTRRLVDNLRTVDPTGSHIKIYCLVALLDEYISRQDRRDAKKNGVVLVGARPPRGDDSPPSIKWIDLYPSAYYSKPLEHLPQMTHIIGHLPYIPNGPSNIRDSIYKENPNVKVILVNHEGPVNSEGNLDRDQLESWCQSGDVIISIGHPLFEKTHSVLKKRLYDVKHQLYLIGCSVDAMRCNWLEFFENVQSGSVTGIQNILLCCPDRQMSGADDFHTAVKAVAAAADVLLESAKKYDLRMTLTIVSAAKDMVQWKQDFHSAIGNNENGQLHLSVQPSENLDKLIELLEETNILIHPQNPDSSYLGFEILNAVGMGVPVLVQDQSSMACFIKKIHPDTTSIVKKLVKIEPDWESWSRAIVDKLKNPEHAAGEAQDLRMALIKDTSVSRTHVEVVKSIIDPVQLEIEIMGHSNVTSKGKKTGKLFGVRHKKTEDGATFVASLLSTFLHQREKTSVEAVHRLLVPTEGAEVDGLIYELVTCIEDDNRCLVNIRAEPLEPSRETGLVLDIHCPTINEITKLCDDLSAEGEELQKLLMRTFEMLLGVESCTLTIRGTEQLQKCPDLVDFEVNLGQTSTTSESQGSTPETSPKQVTSKGK